jgi:hypothetical protein
LVGDNRRDNSTYQQKRKHACHHKREKRRITGWRRARETGSVLVAELLSTVSSMAGSLDGLMSPESAASKKISVVGGSLENYPGFASNKDVTFSFLRVRSSSSANSKKSTAQPIWLKPDEIAGTLGRICGGIELD